MRRRGTVAAIVVSLVVVLVVSSAAGWLRGMGGAAPVAVAPSDADGAFAVSGAADVVGLYPGKSTTATLVVTNTGSVDAVVTSIDAATSSDVPGCPDGAVETIAVQNGAGIPQADGTVRPIAADGTARFVVEVRMVDDAPPGCAGRSLPLDVRVSGSTT